MEIAYYFWVGPGTYWGFDPEVLEAERLRLIKDPLPGVGNYGGMPWYSEVRPVDPTILVDDAVNVVEFLRVNGRFPSGF